MQRLTPRQKRCGAARSVCMAAVFGPVVLGITVCDTLKRRWFGRRLALSAMCPSVFNMKLKAVMATRSLG